MPESTTVQILVQAGAIGLCFYLIYVNRKTSNGQLNRMLDVINNNTSAFTKFSDKLDIVIKR